MLSKAGMQKNLFLLFKQKTAYEMRISDWSSDVCSSDLAVIVGKTKSYPVEGKPGQYLVRKPDEARAWVARGMLDAKADPIDWLVKDLIKIDRNRVAEASVRQPDGETLALEIGRASRRESVCQYV